MHTLVSYSKACSTLDVPWGRIQRWLHAALLQDLLSYLTHDARMSKGYKAAGTGVNVLFLNNSPFWWMAPAYKNASLCKGNKHPKISSDAVFTLHIHFFFHALEMTIWKWEPMFTKWSKYIFPSIYLLNFVFHLLLSFQTAAHACGISSTHYHILPSTNWYNTICSKFWTFQMCFSELGICRPLGFTHFVKDFT